MKTAILQHTIEYHFKNDPNKEIELNDRGINHIERSIKEGCNHGELCQSQDADFIYGWWKIVKE